MSGPGASTHKRRQMAFIGLLVGSFTSVVSTTIVNPTLPTIAADLGVPLSAGLRVASYYLIACAALILPMAALASRLGQKRLYLAGVIGFVLASGLCALSSSIDMVTLGRTLQGASCAAIVVCAMTLIRAMFETHEMGRALGLNALVIAVANSMGPILGGAIVTLMDWRWMFVVSGLPALAVAAIAWFAMPSPAVNRTQTLDPPSALAIVLCVGLFLYGITTLGEPAHLLGSAGQIAVAVMLGVFFLRRQSRLPMPLLPLELFAQPLFSASVRISLTMFIAQGAAFIALPLLLLEKPGTSPFTVSLLLAPWPVMTALSAPIAGRLADRYDSQRLVFVGCGLLVFGLASLPLVPEDYSAMDVLWRTAVCGLGFGIFQSPNNRQMMLSAARNLSWAASGVLNMARTLGQASGASLLSVIVIVDSTLNYQGIAPTRTCLGIAALLAALIWLLSARDGRRATSAAS